MGRPIIISAIDTLKAKTVTRVLLFAYSLGSTLVLAATAPWWLWQMLRTQKYREGISERLGRVPARLTPARQPAIWLHAVSVGEVLAAGRLIEQLDENLPSTPIYISTTTRTGQSLARGRFGAHRVFYYPLDFAFAARAWLRFLQPAVIVLVESEFWPRLLVEAAYRSIPVAVVNARISDRSWPRYQRLIRLWRPLLGTLALALAQSDEDATRLRALGASNAKTVGNLKYDIRAAAFTPFTEALRAHLPTSAPIVVCGSTLAGEESLLLDALPLDTILTILAPRHPERFEEVARLLATRGIPHSRRSACKPTSSGEPSAAIQVGSVLLLDSIGELASLYSLATLAILGGGFLHAGGHNPLEPAQFGVPVLMGTRYDNFRAIVEALKRERAVVLTDPAGLHTTIANLLSEPDRMRAIGARGRQVFDAQAGATTRTVDALLAIVSGRSETVDTPQATPAAKATR